MAKLLIFLLSFLILTRFNIDPDLGWHLAIGNYFWETGEILRKDIFSFSMVGYEWANYFIVYEILVSWLFTNIGYLATVFVFGFLGAVGVLLLLPKKIPPISFVPLVLGLAIGVSGLGVRPLMFSFLLFCFLLKLLDLRFFTKWWHSAFWFLFFALWVNLHQGFLLGLLVFGTFIFLDMAVSRDLRSRKILAERLAIFAAAFLGTFANFFGISLYRSIFLDLIGVKTWSAIAEYLPLVVWWPLNLLYGLSGILLLFMVLSNPKIKRELIWFLIGVFLFSLGFLTTNFAPFWVAIFIFLGTRYLNFKFALPLDSWSKVPIFFSAVAFFMAIVGTFVANFLESPTLSARLLKDGYPVEAVEFLKNQEAERLFNVYHWGGYILWQAPEVEVFIDGRMTGWRETNGRYILGDYLALLKGDCEIAKRYMIKTVLVGHDKWPICFDDFVEVYSDEVARVLVK